ncbi:hypothetical protein [Halobacillus sp. Marseille-P3879]|uniref:hypothetical protein n=1 Tax=Halobacillus sp. Marseille-P3879 TaxID=2045014 RepID=UPI000C7D6E90|nr:hypothetical protein [Halobacillus sp. Marseille-P3879]
MFLTMTTTLLIGLMLFPMAFLAADETKKQDSIEDLETMTYKEKENFFDKETKRINNSYEVNEVFSEKDEKIIKAAARFEENKMKPQFVDQEWRFFGSRINDSIGISGQVSGNVYIDVGWWNHTLSVNGTVDGTNGVDQSRVRVHFVSYGLIGSSGVGKTNDFWLNSGWVKNHYATLNTSHDFSGNIVYTTTDVYGELQNNRGTLVIPGRVR